MALLYPLIKVKDILDQYPGNSKFIEAISSKQGSSSTAFYSIVQPGVLSYKCKSIGCDMIAMMLSGKGFFCVEEDVVDAVEGDCILIRKGSMNRFISASNKTSIIVGFLVGANTISESGIIIDGERKISQTRNMHNTINHDYGMILNIKDVLPEKMEKKDGWQISDFRLPFARHNNSGSTLFRAQFLPGAVHKKHIHMNCDEIYYVISGHGIAGAGSDRTEINGGSFHFIPRGVEHWLYNLSEKIPIEVVGVYCGSSSVADTGYHYLGNVTQKDLDLRALSQGNERC